MSIFQVPLIDTPQSFQVSLGGKEYILTSKWNDAPDGGWVLDFADALTSEPIVDGVPLITGANILEGLDYLGFVGEMYVYTDGDQTAVPTYENLGIESNVYLRTED